MTFGYQTTSTGIITSTGAAQAINLPFGNASDLVKFEIWDETQFGATTADTDMLRAYWFRDMPAASAWVVNRVSGQATAVTTNMVTTGGFTLIDPTGPQLQAAKTRSGASTITSANPAVVTINSHGYTNGDTILLTQTTGLLQIAGWAFTIGSVTTNSFTLVNLDTTKTNLTATATNVVAQKLNFLSSYQPRRMRITNMGASGVNTIITLAETNTYTVGQAVRVYVPTAYVGSGTNPFVDGPIGLGINTLGKGITATIIAIGATDPNSSGITNTITVNVNSSAFTFQWPTSATAAGGVQVPFVEPVGEAATTMAGSVNPANLLDDATKNTSTLQMLLGTNVAGVNLDVIRWIAYRGIILS
jgi:hypothetical protein